VGPWIFFHQVAYIAKVYLNEKTKQKQKTHLNYISYIAYID